MTFPQDTLVDYVRVYQAADTAERFEAGFVDDFTGWRQIYLPFSEFVRSTSQPVGAPNDGLGLTEVWGYGFILPDVGSGLFHMDRVYLEQTIPDTFLLTVTTDGTGSGLVTSDPAGINCGVSCAAEFVDGSVVTLTAVADAGSVFAGWTGAITSSDLTIEVTIDAAKSITATFEEEAVPETFALTVIKAGTGNGLVTSDPAGINCGVSCAAEFVAGSVVTLTAVADAGSVFAGWTGAVTSSDLTIEVTMDMAKNITATFNEEEVTYRIFLPLISR